MYSSRTGNFSSQTPTRKKSHHVDLSHKGRLFRYNGEWHRVDANGYFWINEYHGYPLWLSYILSRKQSLAECITKMVYNEKLSWKEPLHLFSPLKQSFNRDDIGNNHHFQRGKKSEAKRKKGSWLNFHYRRADLQKLGYRRATMAFEMTVNRN